MFGPGKSSGKAGRPRTAREARQNALSLNSDAEFGSLSSFELEQRYPSGLAFYDEPPRCQISLEMMETLAMERLRFLRIMEKHSASASKHSQDWRTNITADLRSQGLDAYVSGGYGKRTETVLENRCRDHFSHFILRLAFSRTEELRRWFIAQEVDAFRWRSALASPEEIAQFMSAHDLRFTPVPDGEKAQLKELLDAVLNSGFREGNATVDGTIYYKVHFTEALDLVRKRSVLVKDGLCYVPETEMRTLLTWMFKSLLAQNVALTAKTLPNLDEDDRLVRMLSDLDRRYTGSDDFSGRGDHQDRISPEMVKPLSEKSFPLCMRSMQATLESTHHLKYKARLQYGLFLKGIGLSMDDAVRFFRGEFTKSHVDAEKFDKEYTYGIRYNYGKEGKKVNWAPWNCMRIIMESVGPGENHGCPYRHHDPDSLRSLLAKSGVEGDDLNHIVQTAKEGHFQKACSMQFKAAHKGQEVSSGVVNHPNQFYSESVHGGPATSISSKPHLKTERASVYLDKAANKA